MLYVTRQEDRKADTRARLLAAAADLFGARGVDGVSVDAVAEAADRTSGAVYAHFGSKQGLLLALLDQWRHPVVGTVLAEVQAAPDLESRLRAVVTNLIVEPSPATRRLLQMEEELRLRASRDPDVAAVLAERATQHRQWLARGLAAWMDGGLIPGGWPADALATVFSATVTGLAQQHRLEPGSVDVESAVTVLTAALTAPPPGRPPTPVPAMSATASAP